MSAMKRIDTHQHFWRLGRGDYTWLKPAQQPNGLESIRRDFMPDDLKPLLQRGSKTRQPSAPALDAASR